MVEIGVAEPAVYVEAAAASRQGQRKNDDVAHALALQTKKGGRSAAHALPEFAELPRNRSSVPGPALVDFDTPQRKRWSFCRENGRPIIDGMNNDPLQMAGMRPWLVFDQPHSVSSCPAAEILQ